jgi:hypothetical protein
MGSYRRINVQTKIKSNQMKKIKSILAITAAGLLLVSCSVSGPLMVTNNKIVKRGVAERKVFLGITFGSADLSIATAARNGNITKVATVDWKVSGGLFSKTYSTIVTGE